jgi:hypothetical protein
MFIKLLEDLRFVIGMFFLIVSVIILSVGYIDPEASTRFGQNMNLFGGWLMGAVSAFMLLLVALDPPKKQS